MYLNQYDLDDNQVEEGARLLDYQPFVLSDEVQTGVAYSWLRSADPRVNPTFVFHRSEWNSSEWAEITDANNRLRNMYDAFIDEIASHFPGGSLLDVACNNGYFPVGAEKKGMNGCAGLDIGLQYKNSIDFLNSVVGTHARFIEAPYDTKRHTADIDEQFDVVVASAIMCHLPDPVNFLAFLGRIAKRGIFFWGQVLESDHTIVYLGRRHEALGQSTEFPFGFNDNNRISLGLFKYAMEEMGFSRTIVLPYQDNWLPRERFFRTGLPLEKQLGAAGSPTYAMLFMRE